MSDFTMGTIVGKGFAQAQVLLTVCTSACAKPFPTIVPMVKLHSLVVATCKNSDLGL